MSTPRRSKGKQRFEFNRKVMSFGQRTVRHRPRALCNSALHSQQASCRFLCNRILFSTLQYCASRLCGPAPLVNPMRASGGKFGVNLMPCCPYSLHSARTPIFPLAARSRKGTPTAVDAAFQLSPWAALLLARSDCSVHIAPEPKAGKHLQMLSIVP